MYKTYDFCLMAPRANLCVEQMAGKQSGQEGGSWESWQDALMSFSGVQAPQHTSPDSPANCEQIMEFHKL